MAKRYRCCFRQRPFHIAWYPSLLRAKDCPSLPLRVTTLPLRLFCSEVQGPHVLLSYYVAHVISCGPGALSSFVTLPGLCLWFFRTCLGFRGTPPDVRSAFFCFEMRSSSWLLPWLGALECSMLYLFLALFPGAKVGCPLVSSRVLWRRLRPLPCSSVCGLHCTGPTNARQSQWEIVMSCAGGQVLPGPLGLRIVSDVSGSLFAAGCNMKELSKTTVSFWLRMPLSRVCWLSVTERSVSCPLRSYYRSVSSL